MELLKNRLKILRGLCRVKDEPLKDAFGYRYEEDESMKENSFGDTRCIKTEASQILKELGEKSVSENFVNELVSSIGSGFVNILRGKMLSIFNISIDKDTFTKVKDPESLDTSSSEFRNPDTIYISALNLSGKRCIVIMNAGKIIEVYGDNIISPSNRCSTVLKKSDTTWKVKNKKKTESVSRASGILENYF